jgi:transposase InsO family protein
VPASWSVASVRAPRCRSGASAAAPACGSPGRTPTASLAAAASRGTGGPGTARRSAASAQHHRRHGRASVDNRFSSLAANGTFIRRLRAMGIRDRPTSLRAPWQNGHVERLIGSIRRECTDHLIVLNAEHLRRILARFATYYNDTRTHISLHKDAPHTRPIERFGGVVAYAILGGLHHRYARI